MALPRANRLRQRREFKDVYHSGLRRTGRYLTLRALRQRQVAANSLKNTEVKTKTPVLPIQPKESKIPTRIGISISQKVSKRAVVRNRIKRQIRAAIRHLLPRISLGWQLVLVVRSTAAECDYAQILRELEQLLVEAEVINER